MYSIVMLIALAFIGNGCEHLSFPLPQAKAVTVLSSGTSHTLLGVYFIDGNTGFVVRDSGTILKTTNSGSTWTNISYSTRFTLLDVFFLNVDTGFVCGEGLFLKTTNSGSSWTRIDSNFTTQVAIHFFDSQNGYVIGKQGSGNFSSIPKVIKTTNRGLSWQSLGTDLGSPIICLSDCGSFYDATHGFLGLGGNPDGGSAYRTTNGGLSWDSVYFYNRGILGVQCFSSSIVYMCSDSGLIVKSTDFGSSWVTQTSGTTKWLTSIFFVSSTNGFVAGDAGIILATTNGGTSWSALSSGTTASLQLLYFPASTVGFAVGDNGTILRIAPGL